MKEPHPPINTGQIVRIIRAMPYINQEDRCNTCVGLEPCDYPVMIDQYFKTYFENCNYRINHFFSGALGNCGILKHSTNDNQHFTILF